ncbi:toxin YoeB [Ekhidna lutea]|uniref:Putative mRNA interferase YoeB n=1 Tax=Ekhidna lutea TaxID=447679 RepID=A0A239KZX3_EKHLU|nr:Txe/YoeB family addiction module toxin [Ekhidna lutea]SNT23887.1 toxin YoeB [Ekhidna lutea]
MQIVFLTHAWEDYLFWQKHNKKMLKRVNELIKQCVRTPFVGIGKPEALKNDLSGWWSRRIDQEHRLVYRVEKDRLYIAQCRKHY